MMDGLVLGWRTVLLTVVGLHLLVGAFLLLRRPFESLPNQILAIILIMIVGHFTPQIIGFAGFYDRWPQLTFTPFANDLILPPLVWAYAWSLTRGGLPPGGHWLWLPGLLEFIYGLVLMVQPLEFKSAWNEAVHGRWILPVEVWGSFILLCRALVASGRLYLRYLSWLNDHTSAAAEFDPRWLGGFLAGLTALALVILVSEGLNLVFGPLSYAQQFPYFIIAGLIFYGLALGALIWHREAFPKMGNQPETDPVASPVEAGGKDWAALEAGFNSKATFNRVFRDITGETPAVYRARAMNRDGSTI